MEYKLSPLELERYKLLFQKMPSKYKKMKYVEWIMFGDSTGIGTNVVVRREYVNGDIFNENITDYGTW